MDRTSQGSTDPYHNSRHITPPVSWANQKMGKARQDGVNRQEMAVSHGNEDKATPKAWEPATDSILVGGLGPPRLT